MRARWLSRAVIVAAAFASVLPSTALAAFPGENGRIVYGADGKLRTIRSDGSGKRSVGEPSRLIPADPEWSPAGRLIAFNSQRFGYSNSFPYSPSIFTIRADGSRPRLLGLGYEPAWAPDGRSLVFLKGDRLMRMRRDGSRRHAIWELPPKMIDGPAWGVSGRIALATSGGLWTLDPDGTDAIKIELDGVTSAADWSPDGEWLLFARTRNERVEVPPGEECPDDDLTNQTIERIRPDGSENSVLYARPPEDDSGNVPPLTPAWSPDGTSIAAEIVHVSAWADCDPRYDSSIGVMAAGGSTLAGIPGTWDGYEWWDASRELDWQPLR